MPPFLELSVLALLTVACGVGALCPANGNTHILYATTNMGNNIDSFDTTGRYLGYGINASSLPQDFHIDKLRSMVFGPDGNLYISSARGVYSKIFAVAGNGLMNGTLNSDCSRDFLYSVVELNAENPFMDHPYGMLFHPEDHSIYVGNQNTVTVTRYLKNREMGTSVLRGKPFRHATWRPAPVSPALESGWTLQSPGNTPAPQKNTGLFAATGNAKYTLSSVRGIALSPLLSRRDVEGVTVDGDSSAASMHRYYLVVCDVVANNLVVFDADDGTYVFSIPVKSPIQVAFPYVAFDAAASKNRAPAPINMVPSGRGLSESSPTAKGVPVVTKEIRKDELFVYVTSKDDGAVYKVPFHMGAERHIVSLTTKTVGQSLSGITENAGHGVLYVADRNGKRISVWTTPVVSGARRSQSGVMEPVESTEFLGFFHVNLPDQPEFLTLTKVEPQSSIPYCYELTQDGGLRYTALCLAVNLWKAIVALIFASLLFLYVRNTIKKHLQEHSAEKMRRASLFHALEDTSDQLALLRKSSGADVARYGTESAAKTESNAGLTVRHATMS